MSIPVDLGTRAGRDPALANQLLQQYGGNREVNRDGSAHTSIGNRPVPPPQAMRAMHKERQWQREEEKNNQEVEEFEQKHGQCVAESRTAWNLEPDRGPAATRQKRKLIGNRLEVRLCDAPYKYEVHGCAVAECNGVYEFSESSSQGAPVYLNGEGWAFHRDRPQVLSTIFTDKEVSEFGWIISKDRKPFYGVRTDDMIAPSEGWQEFLGPTPAPTSVSHTSWEDHMVGSCGQLKEAGNLAMRQGKYGEAQDRYSEAVLQLDGYEDVVASSEKLRDLQIALYANRAEVRNRLNDWRSALEDCRWVLERDPGHAKAAVRLAKATRALGLSSEAIDPLRRLLEEVGPAGCSEAAALLGEAEAIAKCERGESQLCGIHQEMEAFLTEHNRWKSGNTTKDDNAVSRAAETLASSLQALRGAPVDEDMPCLLQSMGVLDVALGAASQTDPAEWSVGLLSACILPQTREIEMRRVLDALPAAAPTLVANPDATLALAAGLLKHQLRQQLRIADRIVEVPGLLAGCLRPWVELLHDPTGSNPPNHVHDVLHELQAQTLKLDNVEGLSLALFVECFIGHQTEKGISGGFALYTGADVRKITLNLLRSWAEDEKILQSMRPDLVSRAWASVTAKLRRDAGVEVERPVGASGPSGKERKMEWFKLKRSQNLRKDIGVIHPEEILEGFLDFLTAHLQATCKRGCEKNPAEGILARPPAEEWMDEVIARPFAWGVLLPLVMAPPSTASRSLALLELLVNQYPHEEKIANILAGLLAFIPLLGLPWPQAEPVHSHLSKTMEIGSRVRCSVTTVLRCAIDSEMGMRVVGEHTDKCLEAILSMLQCVLGDHDQPQSISAAIEILGIVGNNLDCWHKVPGDAIFDILQAFIRSNDKPTRNQLAKMLRTIHRNEGAKQRLEEALDDERLGLSADHRDMILREVYDTKTLAGQVTAQRRAEMVQRLEQTPSDIISPEVKQGENVSKFVDAVFNAYLSNKTNPRVLVMGRTARPICRRLAQAGRSGGEGGGAAGACRIVLGETTLERLEGDDLGPNVEPILLPAPQGVSDDRQLASQDLFDLVITGEPMGYYDVSEYADKLRPFIRRREKEDERVKEQVQWVCVEKQQRTEDARDELYSAGYYKADHDKAYEALRKLALKIQHDVILLALPSNEKVRRKKREQEQAVQRQIKREKEEEEQLQLDEEEKQRQGVLYETLFDPLLSTPDFSSLPVAFEVGKPQGEADVVLFWLHGNDEDPEAYRNLFEELVETVDGSLRVIAPTFSEGRSSWFNWTDETAVNHGLEYWSLSKDPTEISMKEAEKEPARNISFGKPTCGELQCVEELEVGCKQLLNLAEEEVLAGMGEATQIVFGGFSQGGSVATYAALSNTASDDVKPHIQGLILCCSGVPVFHFLAAKMQKQCLRLRDDRVFEHPVRVQMVYGESDSQVNDNYITTIEGFCKRFDCKVALHRFKGTEADRFPQEARKDFVGKAVKSLLGVSG